MYVLKGSLQIFLCDYFYYELWFPVSGREKEYLFPVVVIAWVCLTTLLLVRPFIWAISRVICVLQKTFDRFLPLSLTPWGQQIVWGSFCPLVLIFCLCTSVKVAGGQKKKAAFGPVIPLQLLKQMPTQSWATNWQWNKLKKSWFKWQLYFLKRRFQLKCQRRELAKTFVYGNFSSQFYSDLQPSAKRSISWEHMSWIKQDVYFPK